MLHELAVVLHVVAFHTEFVGDAAEFLDGRARVVGTTVRHDLLAKRFGQRVVHAHRLPLATQVVFRAVEQRDGRAAEHVFRGLLHEFLDERGDRVVVAVGLIRLDHGEFGRVRAVDAFVAEVTVDFEHAVDAAHEAALEEELRCDAQVEVQVEGVHVRGEGACGRTAVHGLQHRRLHLEEVVVVERAAQRRDCLGAVAHHVADLLVGDHADVRLARARVFVEFLVQGGQRLERLGCDGPFVGEDRQLAGLRGDHTAFDEQVVAEVDELLEKLEGIGADLLLREHRLDRCAVARRELHEAQAAGIADEQHAAGHAHHVIGLLPRFERAVVLGAHRFDRAGHIERDRVRVEPLLEHHRAFRHTHLHLFGVRLRAEFLVRRVHGLVKRGAFLDARRDRGVLVEQQLGAFHGRHGRHAVGVFLHGDFFGCNRFSHSDPV